MDESNFKDDQPTERNCQVSQRGSGKRVHTKRWLREAAHNPGMGDDDSVVNETVQDARFDLPVERGGRRRQRFVNRNLGASGAH